MDTKTLVGLTAGILTSFSAAPQVYKIWKEKSAENISFKMFFILALGLATWIFYGILIKDDPIIITNSISLILNLSILILKKYYEA